MEDGWQRVRIALHAPGTDNFWIAPIETVSESKKDSSACIRVHRSWRVGESARKRFFPHDWFGGSSRSRSYSTIHKFWAKGHSSSIHCASQWKPVRAAISMGSTKNICANFPSRWFRLLRGECAGRSREMSTRWRCKERRCISMRRLRRSRWRDCAFNLNSAHQFANSAPTST